MTSSFPFPCLHPVLLLSSSSLHPRPHRSLHLPQLPTPLNPKPILKHPFHLFQTQPGRHWETTRAKDEPQQTEPGVESECPRGGDLGHEREVSRVDDEVRTPVGDCREGGADAADWRRAASAQENRTDPTERARERRDEWIESDQRKVILYTPSNPKSSPCCQGRFPNPLAYDATKMIIDSSTTEDQVCE
jgi:hypothetical protein